MCCLDKEKSSPIVVRTPSADLSAVPATELLNVSANKSKCRLSNSGSIATRRPPSKHSVVTQTHCQIHSDKHRQTCTDRRMHSEIGHDSLSVSHFLAHTHQALISKSDADIIIKCYVIHSYDYSLLCNYLMTKHQSRVLSNCEFICTFSHVTKDKALSSRFSLTAPSLISCS